MYYPTLHLEIARYIAFASRARFDIPWTVSRLIGLPPNGMVKPVKEMRVGRTMPMETPASPKKRGISAGPTIPQPRKVTPMMFDV
jgi:hypothetical protein